MKKRKLGIRFKKQQAREWGWTVPSLDGVELYDIESGEAIEGVQDISVDFYGQHFVTGAVKLCIAAIDMYERPE